MAEVTKELITEIATLCEMTGWKNDPKGQLVSLQVKTRHMSITYGAIVELMELYMLGLEDTLRRSFMDSTRAPEVKVGDVEDLPVMDLRYVDRLEGGTLFFPSVTELAAVDGVKDREVVWVCKRTAAGFCRVPLAVRVESKEAS